LTLDFGQGPAGTSLPGVSQSRTVTLEKNILDANNAVAKSNRRHFESHGVRALNLLSSPGSGKTTLLVRTLQALQSTTASVKLSVIEGDQQTSMDAERIRETGVSVIQVNTGKGCHLDAPMIEAAFAKIHHHPPIAPTQDEGQPEVTFNQLSFRKALPQTLLFIENVGNLVCPALWDLGEAAKIVILSVTEGEDKPLKYPDMFSAANLLIINKIDLLPYVDFNVERAIEAALSINPRLQVIEVSAKTGEGFTPWLDWLLTTESIASGKNRDPAELRDRIAALEAELERARAQLNDSHV
jgi:hydrogenase nickel incorporation protein HypB